MPGALGLLLMALTSGEPEQPSRVGQSGTQPEKVGVGDPPQEMASKRRPPTRPKGEG